MDLHPIPVQREEAERHLGPPPGTAASTTCLSLNLKEEPVERRGRRADDVAADRVHLIAESQILYLIVAFLEII